MNRVLESDAPTQISDSPLFDSYAPTHVDFWRHEVHRFPGTQVPTGTHSTLDEPGETPKRIRVVISEGTVREIPLPAESNLTSSDEPSGRLLEVMERLGEENIWGDTATQEEYQIAEGSSAQERYLARIDEEIESIFRAAENEVFEDGMESEFSGELILLVNKYGAASFNTVACLLFSSKTDVEVVAQALRSLGEMHHPPSHALRRRLLERGLRQSSSWARDGAALGLAWLDDPAAMPSLTRAIQREQIDELREDMRKVLAQLERAR